MVDLIGKTLNRPEISDKRKKCFVLEMFTFNIQGVRILVARAYTKVSTK